MELMGFEPLRRSMRTTAATARLVGGWGLHLRGATGDGDVVEAVLVDQVDQRGGDHEVRGPLDEVPDLWVELASSSNAGRGRDEAPQDGPGVDDQSCLAVGELVEDALGPDVADQHGDQRDAHREVEPADGLDPRGRSCRGDRDSQDVVERTGEQLEERFLAVDGKHPVTEEGTD